MTPALAPPPRLRAALLPCVVAVIVDVVGELGHAASSDNLCWHAGFDEHRCCVLKDAACWDAVFTEARCCPEKAGTRGRGNPRCWIDGYSFDDCCVGEPKQGCWDSEFGPEFCCTDPPEGEDLPQGVLEVDISEAFLRAGAEAETTPLGCPLDGAATSLQQAAPLRSWAQGKQASAAMNVSRQYGKPGAKPKDDVLQDMAQRVLLWTSDPSLWELDSRRCPWGALNTIDIIAAYVDKQVGEQEARAAYQLHASLLASPLGALDPPKGWRLLADGFSYAPRLLGLTRNNEPSGHECHGSPLRIFVQRIPSLSHMTSPVLTCSQKMSQCAASVHIHRWLELGSCITEDPEAADLFYVPAYEACYNETACGFGEDTERCFPSDFDPYRDLPYFQRRRGSDHIFVFACNLLPFADVLMQKARHSIMVTVESYQAQNFAGPNMLGWLSHWKDVLIPGYMPPWRIDAMLAFNQPMLKRSLLVTFHGHSASSETVGFMYKRSPLADVRDRIIGELWNATGASVGRPVRDYFRRMGTSRFCLIPAGLTAWTIHLYEAFFFGCIPVILSDELTVPFQDKIDWPSLSLHVPTTIDMRELHAKLESFSIGRLKAMYRALSAARCWFDYGRGWGGGEGSIAGDAPSDCSPYAGLMSDLRARRQGRGADLYALAPFWEPPPRT
eukprot:TRINITY_DN73110_c0_g1_i1.p1 TRINITY_DN73110_c0_g1~~TRINITY_DN73110_c0_g1_i1.p1  ORF type:complete len:670 (-),score=107.34 TRINITY_DN73110_c0_g1_i1:195-2204(-)